MKAKERFEELGYSITGNTPERLVYWKDKCVGCENDVYCEVCKEYAKFIVFKKNYKRVMSVLSGKEGYSFSLSMGELKAINKQCKELGWYKDESL